MRKKRFKKNNNPYFKFLILLFVLAAVGFFLVFYKLNIFSIKKIDIEANNLTCTDENQLRISSDLLGQNFFMINFLKTENYLKTKYICIKKVIITKKFPDKIKLNIQNRQAFAVLANLEKEASVSATPSAQDIKDYELVDDEGVIFGKTKDNLNLPQIFIYNSKESLLFALKILEKLKTLGFEINNSSIDDKTFIINSNFQLPKIFFVLNDNIDIKIASLQLILNKAKIDSEELEFIDLRFDKPVVKFAPKKQK